MKVLKTYGAEPHNLHVLYDEKSNRLFYALKGFIETKSECLPNNEVIQTINCSIYKGLKFKQVQDFYFLNTGKDFGKLNQTLYLCNCKISSSTDKDKLTLEIIVNDNCEDRVQFTLNNIK